MTEKEKAKDYDRSIERAKKWQNEPNIDKIDSRIIEEIFPELKESDDEKIKTAILNHLKKMWGNCQDDVCGVHVEDAIAWLEKQRDKDKLIQELGEYKIKYTQEVLEKYINSMSNKDDERLRKTAIAFIKDFAEQGYENAVECIDWLEKQGEQASPQTNEELIREWTIQDAKDGDILAFSNDTIVIFKDLYNSTSFHSYCHIEDGIFDFNKDELPDWWNSEGFKPATKEQSDLLFQKIQEAGYKWKYETKTLEKLIKPKFDPKTFKPFDRVLARIDGSDAYCWFADFVSIPMIEKYDILPCIMSNKVVKMIIPYNEDTKHLVGTIEEAPEFYRYWED